MITIFTPTFNRSKTLFRTFISLNAQTCKDFEWLIVDDGSTDDTENQVLEWMKESEYTIRYIKQVNGGKYRAYNNGLRNAKGEFFFCVDSDDWLPIYAVEFILKLADKLKINKGLAGLVALKQYSDNTIIGNPFRKIDIAESLYNLECSNEGGERSIVFKTSIARKYPFPEETDEKFLGESVIYDRFHGEFEFLLSNEVLTICEYQSDGLSSKPYALMLHNPAGYKLYFSQRIDMASSFVERMAYILRYHAFRLLYKGDTFDYKGKYRFLVLIFSPLGYLAKLFYIRKVKV